MPRAIAADEAYHAVSERCMESMRAGPRGVARPVTPADQSLFAALISGGLLAHLEIETFYVFAKILLDRVADTMNLYFRLSAPRFGSSHSALQKTFRDLCDPYSIDGRNVQASIDDLRIRIVDHRTRVIEHLSRPDLARATLWNPREGTQMFLSGRSTEPLAPLLEAVDAYVVGTLAFMRAYARHSIIEPRSS